MTTGRHVLSNDTRFDYFKNTIYEHLYRQVTKARPNRLNLFTFLGHREMRHYLKRDRSIANPKVDRNTHFLTRQTPEFGVV